VEDVRFRSLVGFMKESWYSMVPAVQAQHPGAPNKACLGIRYILRKLQVSPVLIHDFLLYSMIIRVRWGYKPP